MSRRSGRVRRYGRGWRYGLVGGWAVLAAGGWGLTQWVGEPAATSGPAPRPSAGAGAEPGPQPEHWYDHLCDDPPPSPLPTPPGDSRTAYAVTCVSTGPD
ncbi:MULTISPECIES: hypothetical protein [unclassified Streptomyces]|uniref:hypothetical protein n=1 Tax=Streptomyces sp. NPDC055082 TaxID=3365718 RepID=UPI0037D28EC2